jgi:hypothetical protein
MIITNREFEQAGDQHQAVLLALGAVRICWEHPDSGRFDSDRVNDVADDLIRYLHLAP